MARQQKKLPLGKAVNLPNRPKELPTLYASKTRHPLWIGKGQAYVYLQDLSKKAMKDALRFEKEQEIPIGSDEFVRDVLGILILKPGEAVFSRDINGSGKAEDDVIQAWVLGKTFFSRDQISALDDARDTCLGPREERTPERPTKNADGSWSGGTKFEQSDEANQAEFRVFTIGESFEKQTSKMAPAAPGKVHGGWSRVNQMRKDLLKAACNIAKSAFKHAPKHVQTNIATHASMLNTPDLGVDGNYAYGTAQLNIAPAQEYTPDASLKGSMGSYGGPHIDRSDSPGYYTNMTVHSDLPAGYSPGRFHIFGLGICVVLDDLVSINFSGLRYHGGSPPTAPLGQMPVPWAYRFVLIVYPPTKMTNGDALLVLAALPLGKEFHLLPEMTNIACEDQTKNPWCTHSTFATDATVTMDQPSHVRFFARALLNVNLYFLRQLPAEFQVQLNRDQFLQAISTMIDDKRVSTGSWPLGPGFAPLSDNPSTSTSTDEIENVAQDSMRAKAASAWNEYFHTTASHIPYAVVLNKTVAAVFDTASNKNEDDEYKDEDDDEDVVEGGAKGKKSTISRRAKAKKPLPEPIHECTCGGKATAKKSSKAMIGPRPKQHIGPRKNRTLAAERKKLNALAAAEKTREQDVRGSGKRKRLETLTDEEYTDADSDTELQAVTLPEFSDARAGKRTKHNPEPFIRTTRSGTRRVDAVQHATASRVYRSQLDEVMDIVEEQAVEETVSKVHKVIPFIENVNPSSIDIELGIVGQVYRKSANESLRNPKSRNVQYPTLTCLKTTLRQPFSVTQSIQIRTAWAHVYQLDVSLNDIVMCTKIDRFDIMASTADMWEWLDDQCVSLIHGMLAGVSVVVSWITKMVTLLRNIVANGTCDRRIRPSDVDPDLTGEEYWFHPTYPVYGKGKQDARVETHALAIIRLWLGFPTSRLSRYQGHFVQDVIREWSTSALYLDATWDAFNQLRVQVLGRNLVDVNIELIFKPLIAALREHPLSSILSEQHTSLDIMCRYIVAFQNGDYSIPTDTLLDEPADQIDMQDDILVDELHDETDSITERSTNYNLDRLVDYIEELYPLIGNIGTINPISDPSKLQAAVLKHLDKLLPFRERAPSRSMMQKADSPYAPSVARTRQGLFSAVVWRGITFSTPFSLETSPLFADLNDWDDRLTLMRDRPQELSIDPPSSYFCDMAAYGRANGARTTNLAEGYWASSDSETWTTMLEAELIPFVDGYKFFSSLRPNRFAQIGSLAGYLLTADFVYAGVVKAPTLKEMGSMIKIINKGAVSGLAKLGLIFPKRAKKGFRVGNAEEYTLALETVYSHLLATLSEEKRTRMGMDLIMTEHLLCKFHRAIKRGLFKM